MMLSHTSFRTTAVAIAALFLAPAAACASIVVPAGLVAGQKYHLVFVTSGTTTAPLSSHIGHYNDFVNREAVQQDAITKDWGTEWFAIGSTSQVNARDNAVVSAPVYLLDGTTQIAAGEVDMWDGDILSSLAIDQKGVYGVNSTLHVWTGSSAAGYSGDYDSYLGSVTPRAGWHPAIGHWWLSDQNKNYSETFSMYALSEVLTVPPSNAIPEPTSLLVWTGLATAGVWVTRRRRRKS
ncbi:MAG: PEP-CTERM sorting domain-containing protein [Pirellulaceae bacterium]|nr:PEP-CTERM sorting domain-containing protein [Pirellulaceae bacterium]